MLFFGVFDLEAMVAEGKAVEGNAIGAALAAFVEEFVEGCRLIAGVEAVIKLVFRDRRNGRHGPR